jgi:hypothetical protein
MLCEICDQEEAAFSLIPTGEGMPQILGPACLARFALELAKQILPAEEIAAVLGPMFVRPATEAEQSAEIGKTLKRARKRTAEVEAAAGTDGGEDALPAAATDL